jgi:hypothetical protein
MPSKENTKAGWPEKLVGRKGLHDYEIKFKYHILPFNYPSCIHIPHPPSSGTACSMP